jgi:hypothetical protein
MKVSRQRSPRPDGIIEAGSGVPEAGSSVLPPPTAAAWSQFPSVAPTVGGLLHAPVIASSVWPAAAEAPLAARDSDHGLGCGGGTTSRAEPHEDIMADTSP